MTPTSSKSLTLSPQQQAIIAWAVKSSGSLNVNAYAGCAKTTTLMEIAKVIKGQAFMGAFSRAIADEFVERLEAQRSFHVKGSTVHSAGLAAWRKDHQKVEVDGNKVRGLAKKAIGWDRKLIGVVAEGVEYMKQACLGVGGLTVDEEAVQTIVDYFDLQEEIPGHVSVEKYIEMCLRIYRESLEMCQEKIDFSDMMLAPLYYGSEFKKYDWVLVDEVQDTSYARRLILFSMMRPGTRMVAVGDKFQSIFQFSGASADSMEIIKRELGSAELPLSVTYRCPKKVVELARQWVPDYEAHESNPEGVVRAMETGEFWREARKLTPKDVILCRNTRPLVGVAQRLRDDGIACTVEGNSGKGLLALVVKWGEDVSITTLIGKLTEYQENQYQRWIQRENEEKAEAVRDRVGTLLDTARSMNGNKTAMDLHARMEFLMGMGKEQNRNVLRLCTSHRSKGRGFDTVVLLGRNRYMPSKWAKKDWELQAEKNLQYVSVTRTQKEFADVNIPEDAGYDWWEEN